MDVLLVRHGARLEGGGLSGHGTHQIEQLQRALALLGATVDHTFTSRSPHCRETARMLAPNAPAYPLDALTPLPHRAGDLVTLIEQACAAVPTLDANATVLVVGHEGGLSDLVTEMTGSRQRPIGHGELIWVRAGSTAELVAGRGTPWCRHPTTDHQEAALQSKVQSKMTVSTFLAGFVFTALSSLLLLTFEAGWPLWKVISVIILSCSLALYVACVYLYDQLAMPPGFWTDAPGGDGRAARRAERRRERRWHDLAAELGDEAADQRTRTWTEEGPRYHLMLRTSTYLFLPATVLALAGFVALLQATGDVRILIGGCAGLVLAAAFAVTRRPALGAD